MRTRLHHILLCVTLLLAGVCGWLMTQVNVNSDMTKYLPSDSPMKQGVDIVFGQFPAAQLVGVDVRAMFHNLPEDRRQVVADRLLSYDQVNGVEYRADSTGHYVLYELDVPKSVDQKAFGKQIRRDFGRDVVVETAQDGATPPMSVPIIAAAIIFAILFLMAQSWLDPVLMLAAAGVGILLNVGTNALLPSVSITTNYIGAILQLVLSLDFSIVLLNRFREEREKADPEVAVNVAVKRAAPSILSSALTTIVGLLMLCFMRLKIGTDMGVVLAKGVLFSLICTFTVLPSLLVLCAEPLRRWTKPTFVLPTDRLGRFATGHKVSMVIISLTLLAASFFYAKKTNIYFSTKAASRIDEVFTKANPFVIVYHTEDEMLMLPLADSIRQLPGVTTVASYPTLLLKPYSAAGMTDYIAGLSTEMADYMPKGADASMLNVEMMRTAYYLHSHASDTLQIGFRELMDFVRYNCAGNPMFASVIDSSMQQNMALLGALLDAPEIPAQESEPEPLLPAPMHIDAPRMLPPVIVPETHSVDGVMTASIVNDTVQRTEVRRIASDRLSLCELLPMIDDAMPSEASVRLRALTDTTLLYTQMTAKQMSPFVGSTPTQTSMVFGMTKPSKVGKTMTPMEYVHFVHDDLFNRPAMKGMINAEQRAGLHKVVRLMDMAVENKPYTPAELSQILTDYELEISEQQIRQLAGIAEPIVVDFPEVKQTLAPVPVANTTGLSKAPTQTKTNAQKAKKTAPKVLTAEERMMNLLHSDQRYTAAEMAANFNALGQSLDEGTVNMLYSYYGSVNCYNDSLEMTMLSLLRYICDTLVLDPRVSSFMGVDAASQLEASKQMVTEQLGMLRQDDYSILAVMTTHEDESPETYAFTDSLLSEVTSVLGEDRYYPMGESVMYREMRNGFDHEMTMVTLYTILAIFLIVAMSFKSVVIPTILVIMVMTAMYINVIFAGVFSGGMLYLAYLIAQSILMGATIDYGILLANYYREHRTAGLDPYEAVREAYHGSIRTIMTSGLIMVLGTGVMAVLVTDQTIASIVGSIAVGASVAILLILFVLPGVLVAFDKWIVFTARKKA